jgi:hypothetical protein
VLPCLCGCRGLAGAAACTNVDMFSTHGKLYGKVPGLAGEAFPVWDQALPVWDQALPVWDQALIACDQARARHLLCRQRVHPPAVGGQLIPGAADVCGASDALPAHNRAGHMSLTRRDHMSLTQWGRANHPPHVLQNGTNDIVVAREDGTLEIFDVDEAGGLQQVFSTALGESINTVDGGFIVSPVSQDCMVQTFSGKVGPATPAGHTLQNSSASHCVKKSPASLRMQRPSTPPPPHHKKIHPQRRFIRVPHYTSRNLRLPRRCLDEEGRDDISSHATPLPQPVSVELTQADQCTDR